MTLTRPAADSAPAALRRSPSKGSILVGWLTSTDHKVIGYLYLITSYAFFLIGGVLALVVRAELAQPGLQLVSGEQYNQAFTMHGLIMLLLFATPLFVGFHATFLVQHWLGVAGFPRRYADYAAEFTTLNVVSTVGAFLLSVSTLPFVWNVWRTWRTGARVETDDPWGHCGSLEWATSCPPPRHNFTAIPRIRSERPAFDLHHPHLALKD
ncbi:Cytochrome C and Quinol oxidase polypeptide I [Thermomonospora echinospora]|uniref:Cytochrome C and Quinol oxidase polypeptide I n=1 Tax=Thermomonospora echinospora TaxID=1992 RepID=A0A1H5TW23_9ACTN|nr:Cytochrome C and Quinol oxidase polypeptide I [Thermomonospora echinospora]